MSLLSFASNSIFSVAHSFLVFTNEGPIGSENSYDMYFADAILHKNLIISSQIISSCFEPFDHNQMSLHIHPKKQVIDSILF
jgi:hypothetical protein